MRDCADMHTSSLVVIFRLGADKAPVESCGFRVARESDSESRQPMLMLLVAAVCYFIVVRYPRRREESRTICYHSHPRRPAHFGISPSTLS